MRRLVLSLALTLAGCGGDPAPSAVAAEVTPAPAPAPSISEGLALELVAEGLRQPVFLTSPPGGPRRFVVEKPGRILVLGEDGVPKPTPFLDVRRKTETGFGEQGLLGLAFHPKYSENGRFYVNYTRVPDGATVVAELTVGDDPNVADPAERELLVVKQPWKNHNGGGLAFGPDGALYVGMGDGGAGGDPRNTAQNPDTLLGQMLRLDVDTDREGAVEPSTWALGLRNPWRFSFDRATGDLWIGDVGQNRWEEIDRIPAGTSGLNLGWNVMEGTHCFNDVPCDPSRFHGPVLDVERTGRCDSITGGYVYRGAAMPEHVGTYFYGDYCDNWVRSVRWDDGAKDPRDWTAGLGAQVRGLSSFGEDAAGELYVLSHDDGKVYKLVAK